MRQPITPQELLAQWELLRWAYRKKIVESEGVTRSALELMEFQLGKCIDELDQVVNGEYPVTDLLRIVANRVD